MLTTSTDIIMQRFIIPSPLQKGDKIAIVSPASIINPDYVSGAVETLTRWGYCPVVMPHVLGQSGTYSGTAAQRLSDLTEAISDTDINAILCSRGGYGTVHLIESIARLPLRDNAKWLIGFSDISALHALLASQGVASIHGSMCKHLALRPDGAPAKALQGILTGQLPQYTVRPHPFNRIGLSSGRIMGGNMAVLGGLIGTPYDIFHPGTILFIEDIAEPIYKIERILYQLRLSGILPRLSALIVGQFTEYRPDRNHDDMYSMIAEMVAPYDYPVAFDFPIGHVDGNMPVIESANAQIEVTTTGVSLRYV